MFLWWAVIAAALTLLFFVLCDFSTFWSVLCVFLASFVGQILIWAIVGFIATLFVNVDKKNEKDSRFFRFYAYSIEKILKRVLRYKVDVTGLEKLPEGKFLLVGNHRSAFDPIIQLGVFRKYNLSFVSKKENLKMPVFGKIMHRCSCVPLDRDNFRQAAVAISQTADIIKSGEAAMGIYPEGTRNHGEGLLPFKPGAFKIAKKADCPIVVVVMRNSEFVMKNAPFKATKVSLKVLDVLSADFVKENNTSQIGDAVYAMMDDELKS